MPINPNSPPKAKSKQEALDMFRANSRRNSRLGESPTSTAKVSTPRAKLGDKGKV